MEILREHFEECFRHLCMRFNSKVPPGMRGRIGAMKPFMDFCSVTRQTVSRWLDKDEPLPRGEILVKMTCFLDLNGYKVIEFERMPRVTRRFAELIGFGILSPKQATELVQYKSVSNLYNAIWGKEGLSKTKETTMWAIWKEKKDELESKKKEALEKYRLEFLSESAQTGQTIIESLVPPALKSLSSGCSATMFLMQGLLVLLDDGVLGTLSEQEIATLKQSGANTILRLSAHLSTISSKLLAVED